MVLRLRSSRILDSLLILFAAGRPKEPYRFKSSDLLTKPSTVTRRIDRSWNGMRYESSFLVVVAFNIARHCAPHSPRHTRLLSFVHEVVLTTLCVYPVIVVMIQSSIILVSKSTTLILTYDNVGC